ncbi:hypothetical protein M0R45_009365 [Rubus argutus]|uniref:Uncharacterized protein n=1 Tax=Rubus argutus TaxID=59490 RepID=A0AAW1Y792_RUBAR
MAGSILAVPTDIENQCTQLETLMMEELDNMFPLSPLRCIYRVPDRLRCAREEAYTPRVISIGPLHHGKEALKAMEVHKKRYLQYFMGRTNLSLKHYIRKIKDQEAKLRSCYPDTIVLKSEEFVKIILVDVIFLIEFLFRYYGYPNLVDENDCICGKPRMVEDVRPDLQMLENQLPFFILEDLFDPDMFSVPSEYSNRLRLYGVERLSILYLSSYFLTDGESLYGMLNNLETIYSSEVEVQHFVDLLRKLCIAPLLKKQSVQRGKLPTTSPSIEELHLAGVKFKVGSTKNLFDIRFQDGILEIPKLEIADSTELILRNLVAFEQCTFEEFYISDYISIMGEFVDTPKDVKLLVEYKIVENYLGGGDIELSTMINSLSTGIRFNARNFHYGTLCEELNKFCSSKWHKSKANLRHNYFNTPWATISFVAAFLLLILTAIQTICSIISLY